MFADLWFRSIKPSNTGDWLSVEVNGAHFAAAAQRFASHGDLDLRRSRVPMALAGRYVIGLAHSLQIQLCPAKSAQIIRLRQ
jgi:hypothetical protein